MLRSCPVLALTPDVQTALRWFELTHRPVVVGMAGVVYQRVSWPRGDGPAGEDAKLTEALEYLNLVHNAMLGEARARREKGGAD